MLHKSIKEKQITPFQLLVTFYFLAIFISFLLLRIPGVYKEGKYGIRIENLQYTTVSPQNENFLQFRHLTKVPIDKKLIDKYLLSEGEQAWLNKYHEDVYNSLAPYLNEIEKVWLKNACSPL